MSRRLLVLTIAAVLSVALAFVWMNRYRFEKVTLLDENLRFAESMEPALVRIDRLTGKTEALSYQGWVELTAGGPRLPIVLEKAAPDFVPFETPRAPDPSTTPSPR